MFLTVPIRSDRRDGGVRRVRGAERHIFTSCARVCVAAAAAAAAAARVAGELLGVG